MNGTIADSARAAFMHEVMKRFESRKPLEWYQGGHLHSAEPSSENFWLVYSNSWESRCSDSLVKLSLLQADGFPFSQLYPDPK